MLRPIIISLLAAALGACTAQGPASVAAVSLDTPTRAAFAATTPQPASARDQQALVRLPAAAGRIETVRGNSFANGLHQTVGFGRSPSGLRPNGVDLRLRVAGDVAAIEALAIERPTEPMIREELAAQFPNMGMRIIQRPRRNSAGVYGLAVGRWDNGVRCAYAWQWIDNPTFAGPSGNYDAASIRVRFCNSDATLDHLAGLIDDLQFSPASLDIEPQATAPARQVVTPPPQKVARSIPHARSRPVTADRHRTWDEAVLRRTPATPTTVRPIDVSISALDSSLPAAAFRGPASDTRTATR